MERQKAGDARFADDGRRLVRAPAPVPGAVAPAAGTVRRPSRWVPGLGPFTEAPAALSRRIDLWADQRLRLTEARSREELRADILRASRLEGDFRLAEGLSSPYYFDKYMFETRPAVLRRVARLLAPLVGPTERLATQAPGALALGVAVSLETGLPLVILRPTGGEDRPVSLEGELHEGEQVTLVEDVVVTGSRALQGVRRLREARVEVAAVIAVLDREHGASARLEAEGASYRHLFTSSELGIVEQRSATPES
jgi:orotate phosphoribosyltransferase